MDIRDKPFLRTAEAQHLACLGEHKFRAMVAEYGIPQIDWLGVRVYKRADILDAMEQEYWRQSKKEPKTAGLDDGISTGESQTGNSVAGRLEALQKQKPGSRSRRSNSNLAKKRATVVAHPTFPTGRENI